MSTRDQRERRPALTKKSIGIQAVGKTLIVIKLYRLCMFKKSKSLKANKVNKAKMSLTKNLRRSRKYLYKERGSASKTLASVLKRA